MPTLEQELEQQEAKEQARIKAKGEKNEQKSKLRRDPTTDAKLDAHMALFAKATEHYEQFTKEDHVRMQMLRHMKDFEHLKKTNGPILEWAINTPEIKAAIEARTESVSPYAFLGAAKEVALEKGIEATQAPAVRVR